jgi:hypothetical protein
MKKIFKNNDWRDALPILYYGLRFYLLKEIIELINSSNKSTIYKVIISILVVCVAIQWGISKLMNDD